MEKTFSYKTYQPNVISTFEGYITTFFESLSDEIILESIHMDGDYFLVLDDINTSPQMGAIVYWCPETVKNILIKRNLLQYIKGFKQLALNEP